MGRVKTYESRVKGLNVPKPGIPESFKVLIKELQSLALDVKVLDANNEEIDLKQTYDDDDVTPTMADNEAFSEVNDASYDDGYILDREEDADEYENDDYTSDSEDGFDSDDLNDEDF